MIISDATIWSVTYDCNWWHYLRLELARIVNYNRNCSFIVLATAIAIVNYDHKTFIVQATVPGRRRRCRRKRRWRRERRRGPSFQVEPRRRRLQRRRDHLRRRFPPPTACRRRTRSRRPPRGRGRERSGEFWGRKWLPRCLAAAWGGTEMETGRIFGQIL